MASRKHALSHLLVSGLLQTGLEAPRSPRRAHMLQRSPPYGRAVRVRLPPRLPGDPVQRTTAHTPQRARTTSSQIAEGCRSQLYIRQQFSRPEWLERTTHRAVAGSGSCRSCWIGVLSCSFLPHELGISPASMPWPVEKDGMLPRHGSADPGSALGQIHLSCFRA